MNYSFLQFYLSSKSNLKNVMNLLNSEQDKVKDEAFELLYLIVTCNCEKDVQIKSALVKNRGMLKEWLDEYHRPEETLEFLEKKKNIIDDIERMTFS